MGQHFERQCSAKLRPSSKFDHAGRLACRSKREQQEAANQEVLWGKPGMLPKLRNTTITAEVVWRLVRSSFARTNGDCGRHARHALSFLFTRSCRLLSSPLDPNHTHWLYCDLPMLCSVHAHAFFLVF